MVARADHGFCDGAAHQRRDRPITAPILPCLYLHTAKSLVRQACLTLTLALANLTLTLAMAQQAHTACQAEPCVSGTARAPTTQPCSFFRTQQQRRSGPSQRKLCGS